jgi:hypothetical protein
MQQSKHAKPEWTVQRIAEALGVGKTTIHHDLDDCSTVEQLKHAKTATNPKASHSLPRGRESGPSEGKGMVLSPEVDASSRSESPLVPEAKRPPRCAARIVFELMDNARLCL